MQTNVLHLLLTMVFSLQVSCSVPDIFDEKIKEQRQATAPTIFVEITSPNQDIWQQLSIDSEGVATLTNMVNGQKMIAQLSKQRITKLEQAFEQNRFDNFEGSYEDAFADGGLRSEISYSVAGATKTVVTEHTAAPAGLQDILAGIAEAISDIHRLTPELQLQINDIATDSFRGYELRLIACNRSGTDLTLLFNNGKLFDFRITSGNLLRRDNGASVWDWGETLFFPDGISELRLLPGQCQTYTVNWNGKTSEGGSVQGDVWVQANLHSIPGGSPAQQRINR